MSEVEIEKDTVDARVTNHASRRIRERIGIKKKSVNHLALKALNEGLSQSELSGNLKKYVCGIYFKTRNANNIKVLHDKVFLFKGNTLITVLPLPQSLAKLAQKLIDKKAEKSND